MESGLFSNQLNKTLGAAMLGSATLALLAFAFVTVQQSDLVNDAFPTTISVNGEGEVLAVPDIGQFSFSVNAEGKDAAMAQEESGTKINDIIAYLKEQGIDEKDIKTQNYNLYPKWTYQQPETCPIGSYCPGERVQDGFEVTQSVSVKVRDTDKAGAIIAGVGERGATNISSLNFTIDDVDALREEARELAIEDAKDKAKILADQLGVDIVRLSGFYEGGDFYDPFFYEARAMSMDMEESGFGGADLPMGEESTTVSVELIYEVK
tara:strand:+ start:4689 stop:5483 length:795 start_codon:yes stop_codon:yes gene_type:complete